MYQKILLGTALILILCFAITVTSFAQSYSTASVVVSRPELLRLDGTKLFQVKQNSQVMLTISIENKDQMPIPYVAIIEVRTKEGITSYLQFQKGTLAAASSTQVGTSWQSEKSGDYVARAFLLSDLSNPIILSSVMQSTISVGFIELEDANEVDNNEQDKEQSITPPTGVDLDSNPDISPTKLKLYALSKINEDRKKYSLAEVQLSDNEAAQVHAEDVFRTMKISHWMTNGEKPYMTYSRYGGTGDVGQNVATSNTKEYHDNCVSGKYLCNKLDPYEEIAGAEYAMMYDDEECCDNGHRDNILDNYHTHVSIGIAYDDYYFVMVQNFENQYITWTNRIDDDNPKPTTISMAGYLERNEDGYSSNDITFDAIQVFYDPIPTHATYQEHYEDMSYDPGQDIAVVVEPLRPGWYYEQPEDYRTIEATEWHVYKKDFEVVFSLDDLVQKYGNGVYTISVWCMNTSEDDIVAASTSVFVNE